MNIGNMTYLIKNRIWKMFSIFEHGLELSQDSGDAPKRKLFCWRSQWHTCPQLHRKRTSAVYLAPCSALPTEATHLHDLPTTVTRRDQRLHFLTTKGFSLHFLKNEAFHGTRFRPRQPFFSLAAPSSTTILWALLLTICPYRHNTYHHLSIPS